MTIFKNKMWYNISKFSTKTTYKIMKNKWKNDVNNCHNSYNTAIQKEEFGCYVSDKPYSSFEIRHMLVFLYSCNHPLR